MIGIDTNVLVRYLTQDDAKQAALATKFIERSLSAENPGLVTLICLCEIVWVLAECYDADRKRIRAVIEGLLATKQIKVESADLVWKAVRAWDATAADFSDALIGEIVRASDGAKTVTFDRAAARLPTFELLQ